MKHHVIFVEKRQSEDFFFSKAVLLLIIRCKQKSKINLKTGSYHEQV
jgi:hypothetical protein